MLKLKTLLAAGIMLLPFHATYAQSYKQALEFLKDNQREKALTEANALINAGKDVADANLLAAMIEIDNEHFLAAFKYFQAFYDAKPNAYHYVYALGNTGIFGNAQVFYDKNVTDFLKRVATDEKAPGVVRSDVWSKLAVRVIDEKGIKGSNELYSKLCDVRNWSTVGVFENVSGSGFNKDFGPLAYPEAVHEFTNKHGAKVKWFNMLPRSDRWWDFEYNYDASDAVIYAQTFIESTTDREVLLNIGVSGSMKVWVNDFMVGTVPDERNTDEDVYSYKVKLQKGYNRVLLQIGSSEINNSNFMVHLADVNGKLIEQVTSVSTAMPYTKAVPYKVEVMPFAPEVYFEKLVAEQDNFINELLLLDVYNHNDNKYEARKIAGSLKKRFPKTTMISGKYLDALSRDNNQIDYKRESALIKVNDPESLSGLQFRYIEEIDNENYDKAMVLLNRRVELYGENEVTEKLYLELLAKKKDLVPLSKRITAATLKYPASSRFLGYDYLVKQEVSKNMKQTNKILENYLDKYYDEEISEVLAAAYFNAGEQEKGLRILTQFTIDRPYAVGRFTKLANKYYELRNYPKALENYQKAIDIAPYIGNRYYSKGVVYELMGQKDNAKEMYSKALHYSPTDYSARRKLRQIAGMKDLADYFKVEDVDQLYNDAILRDTTTSDNLVMILNDVRQIIYPEKGVAERTTQMLIHVLTQAGINELKQVSLPYNSYTQSLYIKKAEIIKSDGSHIDADVSGSTLVFSSLEKNDAINVIYKIEESNTGMMAEHFCDDFAFNSLYPTTIARYSLIAPANKPIKVELLNTDVKAVVTNVDDYKMTVWEKRNCPAIKPEALMPAFLDMAERITLSSIPSWKHVANWYRDISTVKARGDYEVREKVKELFSQQQPKTDLDKAKVIYSYIVQNFNYSDVPFLHSAFTPQRASATLNAKLGDCKDLSTLFVSMCREAGMKANLVLIDTRDNGYNHLVIPSIAFNHCIAYINIDKQDYFVEMTDNFLPFGAVGAALNNANGLMINPEGAGDDAKLIRIKSRQGFNKIERLSSVTLSGTAANIVRKSYRTGAEASQMRRIYKDATDEARINDITSTLTQEFSKNLKVEQFDILNLDDVSDTLVLDYKFTIDDYVTQVLGMQVIKIPWTDNHFSSSMVSLDKRTQPVDLWFHSDVPRLFETMTLMLPAGKKLGELPKNVSLACPEMSYKLTYTVKADRVIATRELLILKENISVEGYGKFKDFIVKMNQADNQQLVIK